MKMLICHSDTEVVQRLLNRPQAGRNILVHCRGAEELVSMVAATEPHLVVIGRSAIKTSQGEAQRVLLEAGFKVPIRLMTEARPSDEQLDELWRALAESSGKPESFAFDSENYQVLTESPWEKQVAGPAAREETKELQEDRFLALLATGKVNHQKARTYLAAAEATERHCEPYWASAALISEPIACLWRTQAFRYASVLAHYVPGVEVDCLPLAHPLSPSLDYLPTGLPGEACYALSALATFGIHPQSSQALWNLGAPLATNDRNICEYAACLAGWARFLQNMAGAHVWVLDRCLSSESVEITTLQTTRQRCRFQTFCRWWNLNELLTSPDAAKRLIAEFNDGRRAEGVPAFYSFYNFTEKIQERIRENLNRN
ncbi:MAG TPA: hypothetical protein VFE51_11020 [Verrucomicrobiae bacterium]|nr:hypothetical protein [Verrucomicrobiae bacterium]